MNVSQEKDYSDFNVTDAEQLLTNQSNGSVHLKPVMMPVGALAMFFSLVFLTSLLGNIAVVLVVFKIKRMKTRMNYLLANLSVGSLGVTALCMPFFSVEYLMTSNWILEGGLCRGVHALEITLTTGCILTVLAISYDRYLGICYLMNTYTKWRAIGMQRIITVIWVTSLALAFPMVFSVERITLLTTEVQTVTICSPQTDGLSRKVYLGTVSAIFIVVFVIIIYLICRMSISLCTNRKRRPRVVVMIISVAVVFLICLLPYRVLVILFIMFPFNSAKLITFQTTLLLYELFRLATFLNFALNPILYNFMSGKFNKAFKELIRGNRQERTNNGLKRKRHFDSPHRVNVLGVKMKQINATQILRSVNKC